MSMPGRPPAPVTPEEVHDLSTPEEIAQRRRRRLWTIIGIVAAILIALGALAARPTVHAIKGWQARRAAAEAMRLAEAGDPIAAFSKIQDAMTLRSTDPEVMRAAAVLLTRVEHGREAIAFWNEIEKKRRLTADEQRDYALDLLLTGNVGEAASRSKLAWPDGTDGTPADWLVRMQIAARTRDGATAVSLAKRLSDGKTAGIAERQRLEAALVLSSITDPSTRQAGETALRALANGGKSVESLEALISLLKQDAQQIGLARERQTAAPEAVVQNLLTLADQIEKHPAAKVTHQLIALQARIVARPDDREKLLRQAVERYGGSSDNEDLVALASWLYGQGEYQRVMEVVTPERSVRARGLYLSYLDTLGALNRWADIRRTIEGQKFTLDPMVEQMYLARCAQQLKQPETATLRWDAALRAAGTNFDKLLTLGRYALANGAVATSEAAYRAAIKAGPDGRPAYEGLLGALQFQGRTREARENIQAMLAIWPDDSAVRNDDAYLGVLLGADLAAGRNTARELVRAEPGSVPHRITLALAELRLGNGLTALETLAPLQPEAYAIQPRFQAVCAAVLWATDQPADARKLAAQIPADRLLPEERALLADIDAPPKPAAAGTPVP